MAEWDNEHLRELVGWVPQDAFLFAGTVAENITLGLVLSPDALESRLAEYGLLHRLQALPAGLQTLLAERGANISSGERQLIAMARALVRQPRLLILDEATASMDSQTEHQLQQSLLGLKGRLTLIVIAHRLSTIAQADHVVVMRHGEIAEQGSHAALLEQRGSYFALHQMQSSQFDHIRETADAHAL